jgi:ABC-2 type transport system permease protein
MRPRSRSRRGGFVFSLITSLLFYGFWTFLGAGVTFYFSDPDEAANFVPALSSGLLFVMLYWQLAPVVTAGFGASLDSQRLLIYPIPRGKLFTIEILLRLASVPEMVILTAAAAIGLMRNPLYGAKAAPLALSGFSIFVAVNVLLSAGMRSLMERFFQRTRLKEAMLLLLVATGLGFRALFFMRAGKVSFVRFAPAQIFWPWAATARLMLGDPVRWSLPVALLYLVAAYVWGRRQFERGFRSEGNGLGSRERDVASDGVTERLFRLPSRILPDPIAALVEKELRTLVRIPRFRMGYAMSCFFGIAFFLPSLRRAAPGSFFLQNALTLMALYGLLMLGPLSYWNAFGFDRSAVQGYFSWPVKFRSVLVAKNITVVLLIIPQIVVVASVGKAVQFQLSPWKFVETVIVILIASLYWFAMGNICSVRIPRAMDAGKMSDMGNKIQALSIWAAPILLLPIVLAYWARAVFDSELVFGGVLLIAAIVGGIFYVMGLDSAANSAVKGREAMLMQLSQADGPLSIT